MEGDYGHSYRSPRREDRRPSPPQWSGEQGRYSVRDRVDTPGFFQSDSSTRQEIGRVSPHRRPASFKVSAALGAPPQRAPWGSPARTQAPQGGSSNHQERTNQTVHPSPRRTRPTVSVSGTTRIGPPIPPVPLYQFFNLNSEELMYHTSEDELEHRARDGSPHSQRSGERDPPAMDD